MSGECEDCGVRRETVVAFAYGGSGSSRSGDHCAHTSTQAVQPAPIMLGHPGFLCILVDASEADLMTDPQGQNKSELWESGRSASELYFEVLPLPPGCYVVVHKSSGQRFGKPFLSLQAAITYAEELTKDAHRESVALLREVWAGR
jgi:hypothetical protein